MAKKKRIRVSEWDAERLNQLLVGETVVSDKGIEGKVVAITPGGIQVQPDNGGGVRPYPIYASIMKGELRFKEEAYQQEMVSSLRLAKANDGAPSTQRKGLTEKVSTEPKKPQVEAIDISGNIGLICFFKNIDEERLIQHMENVGLEGFDESLERGFEKNPYVALREAEYYLGCPLGLLLSTYEEFLQRIFKECTTASSWAWTEGDSKSSEVGKPHRSVKCENKDGVRNLIVHAIYDDLFMRNCIGMQCNLLTIRKDVYELGVIKFAVISPKPETVRAFDEVYKTLGVPAVPAPQKPAASNSVRIATAPSASAKKQTTVTLKKKPNVASDVKSKPIHVNEFLVRRSYGTHRTGGHRLDPIRATVSILPKTGGNPFPVEFDAYWCPKCRKYFMGESTYLRLKRQGYICCKVVEEKDLGTKRTGDGLYGNLASESILHMYGYNVNQQDDLSEAERQTIISFVIENGIQTTQDIAHLLEWLISQREGNARMSVAVSRWRADLKFVKRYHKPTRKVKVDRIYAKI